MLYESLLEMLAKGLDAVAELWPSALPVIDQWLAVAIPAAVVSLVVIVAVDKADMRDGKRDIPFLGKVVPYVGIFFEFVEAVIALSGVRLPRVSDLRRFKELYERARMLAGSPHPDDLPGNFK